MKIILSSDFHGHWNLIEKFPDGDVLIISGDLLKNYNLRDERIGKCSRQLAELIEFDNYIRRIDKYKYIILIAGNHDFVFQNIDISNNADFKFIYLMDSGVTIAGVKFYGSPWQPWFYDWAFNLPRNGPEIKSRFDLIPKDTDVLITHTPPFGVLDEVDRGHVGCEKLSYILNDPNPNNIKLKPKINTFGHIHEGYGKKEINGVIYINASICDKLYRPINDPFEIEYDHNAVPIK